jgi:hypothetical protein
MSQYSRVDFSSSPHLCVWIDCRFPIKNLHDKIDIFLLDSFCLQELRQFYKESEGLRMKYETSIPDWGWNFSLLQHCIPTASVAYPASYGASKGSFHCTKAAERRNFLPCLLWTFTEFCFYRGTSADDDCILRGFVISGGYYLPDITEIKSRSKTGGANAYSMQQRWEMHTYTILDGKPEGNRPFGRPSYRWCYKI